MSAAKVSALPVQKCACGADCDWCIGANEARKAFPKAKSPPLHDAATEHQCVECFLRAARARGEKDLSDEG